jgi:hypothetical protein
MMRWFRVFYVTVAIILAAAVAVLVLWLAFGVAAHGKAGASL